MINPAKFEELDLRVELLAALSAINYDEMTPVQEKSLPPMLAGTDVLAQAKTGSGKTAAFGLAVLNKLKVNAFHCQALILCPTRELADQVARELRRLASATANVKILSLCGGAAFGPQLASLQHNPHIVVGTPGRIHKHLRKDSLQLGELKTLVLDEADRMLDMGFSDEINAILKFVPKNRQTLLFSATFPPSIEAVSRQVQRNAQSIQVTDTEVAPQIIQSWCATTREDRQTAIHRALRAWGGELNLVFCNTKIDCIALLDYLQSHQIAAVALHGDLEQAERNEALVRFSNRSASVLVATDVAARGIDIKDLDVVFNFELPKQAEVYVHRIGRTGRAGNSGKAISLVDSKEEWRWQDIAELQPDAYVEKLALPDPQRGIDSLKPKMQTIRLDGGRRNKLRPGDILGALTADGGVNGKQVGSIDLFDTCAYVAVATELAKQAAKQLNSRPIKKKKYRARLLR